MSNKEKVIEIIDKNIKNDKKSLTRLMFEAGLIERENGKNGKKLVKDLENKFNQKIEEKTELKNWLLKVLPNE